MGTTADKLKAILETKQAIKQAIRDKGVYIGDLDPLDYYPTAIGLIETSSSNPDENNPYQQLYMQRTANETSMKGLFAYTPASTTLDLSVLDTSKVTDMSYMFSDCKVPYLDLSGFDVSNVTKVNYMFNNCTSEVNIDGWDTSKLTDFSYMLQGFEGSIDATKIDFSNATNISYLFNSANTDRIILTGLSFPKITSFERMFYQAEGTTLDLSSWDITNITNLSNFLGFAGYKTIDLTGWKTTKVTNMNSIFYYCSSLEKIIIPDWDMTNTTNTSSFFQSSSKFNYIDLSRSNDATIAKIATLVPAQKLATYGQILIPADSSQANIDALVAKYWKPVGPRLDMTSCEIATELDEIKPGKSTKLYYGNQEPWYGNDSNVEYISSDESVAIVDKETMMVTSTGVEGTTEITARNADTQEVISSTTLAVSETDNYPNIIKIKVNSNTSTTYVVMKVNGKDIKGNECDFNSITKIYTYDAKEPITSFKISASGPVNNFIKLNTSNITSMSNMLANYLPSNFDSSSLNEWDTSNVTDMNQMFYYCTNLTELDLSNFNTSKVTDMGYMFFNCYNLTLLDLSNFDMTNVENTLNMFGECNKLHTLRLDNCNYDTISRIIKQAYLPTGTIDGVTRKIYCKEENAADLTAPDGWEFIYIDSSADSEEPIPGGPNVDGGEPGGGMPGMPGTDGPVIAPEGPEVTPDPEPSEPGGSEVGPVIPPEGPEEEPTGTYQVNFSAYNGTGGNAKKLTVNNVDVSDQVVEVNRYEDTISYRYETTEPITQVSFKDNTDLIRLFSLDSSNITDMSEMFDGCTSFVGIVGHIDCGAVTNMNYMFRNCTSLSSIPDSYFTSMANVSDMTGMYYNCSSMTGTAEASKYWGNSMVGGFAGCFHNCTSLDNYSEIPMDWGGPSDSE